eukprot:Sspe_Gene.62840::Locus_35575_Transcript_2_3_Confidence_0.400_Length_1766::g.62840::m.62840/K07964/HPSE; heparanase
MAVRTAVLVLLAIWSVAAAVHVTLPPAIVSTTSPNFLCWNIDASRNRGFFDRNLSTADPHARQMAHQATVLADNEAGRAFLRFGGSGNDYLTYAVYGTPCPVWTPTTECLNQTWLGNLLDFARASRADIIFGVSLNTGEDAVREVGSPKAWNSSNALSLLKWIKANGYSDVIHGFELGNEQNHAYTGREIAQAFQELHRIIGEVWSGEADRPGLFGPDPHSLHTDGDNKTLQWMVEFVTACREYGVPLEGVTHHEYIEVDITTFTSPDWLDRTMTIATAVNATISPLGVQVWAGEIGPHNGGSPPCNHEWMRWSVFGNSLWYVDSMGSKARAGYTGYCRQDYIGADYGLLDCATGTPLPDYYAGWVWTKTMGTRVLAPSSDSRNVRVYAHCANRRNYPRGAVTVVLLNLASAEQSVSLPYNGNAELFVLTPSSDPKTSLTPHAGLNGTGILLNSKLLEVDPTTGSLPTVEGERKEKFQTLTMPPTSIVYAVLLDVGNSGCL